MRRQGFAVLPGLLVLATAALLTGADGRTAAQVVGQPDPAHNMDAGGSHVCIVADGGAVACWGANGQGQLGDGTTTFRRNPVFVAGLTSGVRAVATGYAHSCALMETGAVKCWGNDDYGQLGPGAGATSLVPHDVSGLPGPATAISAGGRHTCAVLISGATWCWGLNSAGQLGDGTTVNRSAPAAVTGLPPTQAVEAGFDSTCALSTAGGIRCWGSNSSGTLGNDSHTDSSVPVQVTGLQSEVTAISMGYKHACALTTTRGLRCWGVAGWGQLGTYVGEANSPVPVAVAAVEGQVLTMSAGHSQTCAILVDRTARCWGLNSGGELGDGTTELRGTPVPVVQFDAANETLAAGGTFSEFFTCARSGTSIQCWGENDAGQLAAPSAVLKSATPLRVVLPAARLEFQSVSSIVASGRGFGVQPVVRAKDVLGNAAIAPAPPVTVTLTLSPISGHLICGGGSASEAKGGVATFQGCRVAGAGAFQLVASAPGALSATTDLLVLPARATMPLVARDDVATPVPSATATPVTPTLTPPATTLPTQVPKHTPSATVTINSFEPETGADGWSNYVFTLRNTGTHDLDMQYLYLQSWYSADPVLGGGDDCGAAFHNLQPGAIAPGDSVTLNFGANIVPSPAYWPQCVHRTSGYVIVEVHTIDPNPLYNSASWWASYPVIRSE